MARAWVVVLGGLALLAARAAHADEPSPELTLVVAEGDSDAHAAAVHRLPIRWQAGSTTARAADGAFEVTLTIARGDEDAATTLTIDGQWLKAAWVHRAALELALPGDRVELVGRDLKPARARAAWLERFDPKWITVVRRDVPIGTLLVDDTVDAVEVRASGSSVTVRLDLDSADARPFLHDARCTKQWRQPNRHLPMPARWRKPGDHVSARVQLLAGRATPLIASRFPDGRRAALVVTDHADQSSERTLAALAHGLIAHHLTITKSLFAHGADRPQLEVPAVASLADALVAAGSEIVPHSATPRADERSATELAMKQFERWRARTWIDHQPETNCEAFGDEGWRTDGKYGIADLLAAHDYRWVWAEDDAPPGDLNLLEPRRLDHRAPTVWPIGRLQDGGPDSLWMFRSMWAFLEARRFYKMYAPERLDRLEEERGLHIAHTYLETYHPRHTRFGLRNLLLPADDKQPPGGPGAVVLDPRFDALLSELEARQSRGSLWVPTLALLGDRLRATAELTVRLAADGSAVVHAPRALAGATFVVPRADVGVALDGKPPRGRVTTGGETTFWVDLPEGDTTVRLTSTDGAPLPFAGGLAPARAQK